MSDATTVSTQKAISAFMNTRQDERFWVREYSRDLRAQVRQSVWLVGGADHIEGRTAPHISQNTAPSLNRAPHCTQNSPLLCCAGAALISS
jgi:hypothetical protein